MAKKKQVNQTARIAVAIDWLEAALKNDPVAGSNDFLSLPLGELKEELVEKLVKKTLESGKQEKSKGKGGKQGGTSTQDPPTDSGAAATDANTRF